MEPHAVARDEVVRDEDLDVVGGSARPDGMTVDPSERDPDERNRDPRPPGIAQRGKTKQEPDLTASRERFPCAAERPPKHPPRDRDFLAFSIGEPGLTTATTSSRLSISSLFGRSTPKL
jgi:hypothetical protein